MIKKNIQDIKYKILRAFNPKLTIEKHERKIKSLFHRLLDNDYNIIYTNNYILIYEGEVSLYVNINNNNVKIRNNDSYYDYYISEKMITYFVKNILKHNDDKVKNYIEIINQIENDKLTNIL